MEGSGMPKMPSVQTLYQLAFHKTCLHLWQSSPLLALHAEFAHKYKKKYADEESEDVKEYQNKTSAMLEGVEKSIEQTREVPLSLMKMIMTVVNSIDDGVCDFITAMARGLTRKTLNNIKFCAQHIVYTKELTINMTESFCNILLKSRFDVMFTRIFLAGYCVKKSKLKKVCNKIEADGVKVDEHKMVDVYDFIEEMTTGKKFWEKRRHKDGMEDANNNMLYATDMQYVGVVGPFDALKYYYERARREFEDGSEGDDYMLDCAKYLFLLNATSPERIAFFQEKLYPETWMGLLKDEFHCIFLTYLQDWRYRDRCMPLFFQAKGTIDKKTVQTILREILMMLHNKYDSYGIINVAKELWDEIPREWITDAEIADMVPGLVLPAKNFDILPHFLKDYNVDMQEDIIANAIFQLVATSEEKHIDAIIRTAQASGFEQKEGKQFLTIDRLKHLLIHDARKFTTVDYDKVGKYLCNCEEEGHELKQRLLQDKYFITDFLVNISYSLQPFFEWALKEEREIKAFKEKLLEGDVLDCVYERRLIEMNSFYDASKIFSSKMLNLDELQIADIQERMKHNTMVVHCVLRSSLHKRWFSCNEFLKNFSFSKKEGEDLIREFLHLPETIQAVYDMVLDLANFVKSMKCSKEGSHLMLTWINFITVLVEPYTDVNAYKNLLLEDLNAVVSECNEKVQRHPKFSQLPSEDAEFNIKVRLRCFSACFERRRVSLEIGLQNTLLFAKTDAVPFMYRFLLAHLD